MAAGMFVMVDVPRVIMDAQDLSTAEFGAGVVHGMKCWANGTVGDCCPAWIRDAWADAIKRGGRGTRPVLTPYYGSAWPRIRAEVIARDGSCRSCGEPDGLDVHHRVPIRAFTDRDEANRLSNLVALCRPCHARADAAYRADGSVFPQSVAVA